MASSTELAVEPQELDCAEHNSGDCDWYSEHDETPDADLKPEAGENTDDTAAHDARFIVPA